MYINIYNSVLLGVESLFADVFHEEDLHFIWEREWSVSHHHWGLPAYEVVGIVSHPLRGGVPFCDLPEGVCLHTTFRYGVANW